MKTFEVEPIGEHNEKNLVNVVFVHGLVGDLKRTWGMKRTWWPPKWEKTKWRVAFGEDKRDFWPAELKNANVWTAGYHAPLFEALHRGKIEQLFSEEGETALRQLVDKGLGQKKIIFVAHSLGGLLVKSILRSASITEDLDKARILQGTHAVFFLGTPHSGSDRARLRHIVQIAVRWAGAAIAAILLMWWVPLEQIGQLFGITAERIIRSVISAVIIGFVVHLFRASRHLKLLDPANPELRTLQRDYRQLVSDHPSITTFAYFETMPTKMLGILVPWASADPGITNCEPQPINDASHTQLCKRPHVDAVQLPAKIQAQIDIAIGACPVFEHLQRLQEFNDDKFIGPLCLGKSFKDIPAFQNDQQARREAEESLRKNLRTLMREGKLKPLAGQLEAAKGSPFDLDKFVWYMWYEVEFVEKLRKLREDAEKAKKAWQNSDAHPPSLILFYRVLRAIEHIYSGDFLEPHSREGQPTDRDQLLALVTKAYNDLQKLRESHQADATRPDGDGSTRWLLVRMECALKAMDAALEYIGPWSRPSGQETESMTADRISKHQRFLDALDKMKDALFAKRRISAPGCIAH
ncbi:MAG: hypothetical protein OJF50_003698 [Nitrospira sp.]|jgi:hypothetical protein|nr:hypothetical protein [Nitrospira sp.]